MAEYRFERRESIQVTTGIGLPSPILSMRVVLRFGIRFNVIACDEPIPRIGLQMQFQFLRWQLNNFENRHRAFERNLVV